MRRFGSARCTIHFRLIWCYNYRNRSRSADAIAKSFISTFSNRMTVCVYGTAALWLFGAGEATRTSDTDRYISRRTPGRTRRWVVRVAGSRAEMIRERWRRQWAGLLDLIYNAIASVCRPVARSVVVFFRRGSVRPRRRRRRKHRDCDATQR